MDFSYGVLLANEALPRRQFRCRAETSNPFRRTPTLKSVRSGTSSARLCVLSRDETIIITRTMLSSLPAIPPSLPPGPVLSFSSLLRAVCSADNQMQLIYLARLVPLLLRHQLIWPVACTPQGRILRFARPTPFTPVCRFSLYIQRSNTRAAGITARLDGGENGASSFPKISEIRIRTRRERERVSIPRKKSEKSRRAASPAHSPDLDQ